MDQVRTIIKDNLDNCLTQTDFPLGTKHSGKVRDRYGSGDTLFLITTDRQSAFDRILAAIPFKGQVLNETSVWWFERTRDIIGNHVLDVPDPNVTVARTCEVFPVEFVVRGYITGTTNTSLWTHYERGARTYCGNALPEGLRKNEKLRQPLLTPTTKALHHDRPVSPREILKEGLMEEADWSLASDAAMALFDFGQRTARNHDLILVDTKYEFGKDPDGNILLVDEIHTPDSSRYWLADSYEARFSRGEEPENIDKEFLRLWFVDHCDPYRDKTLPEPPEDLVIELSRRYIQLYEMITGRPFSFPDRGFPITERIEKNLSSYLSSG
ncbi:MAG: phosphoribosylaminoimidazolesuccinocarboxamide synthase [Fidelibacterota bacterium]